MKSIAVISADSSIASFSFEIKEQMTRCGKHGRPICTCLNIYAFYSGLILVLYDEYDFLYWDYFSIFNDYFGIIIDSIIWLAIMERKE